MEYTHLGRSGLRVSRLCLGTMNFGPLAPPADAHVIMDYAHEIGINFFDTANRYGGGQTPPGQVARTVERALTARRPRTCYLSGKNARRMALIAALLPPAAQDALRRRLAHQPARASRVG